MSQENKFEFEEYVMNLQCARLFSMLQTAVERGFVKLPSLPSDIQFQLESCNQARVTLVAKVMDAAQ